MGFFACKKEDPIESNVELTDKWYLFDADSMSLVLSDSYKIHFTENNELYAIQSSGGSSFTNCHCKTAGGDWKRFAVDSLNPSVNPTLITRERADGSLWILTETRLSQVTSCGSFVSYEVASTDSTAFLDFMQRFSGLEIVDGIPWLLHAKWGLYHFDLNTESLVHHPILDPFPFYTELSEIGNFQSLAQFTDGKLLFNNFDGRAWVLSGLNDIAAFEPGTCFGCLYNKLRTNTTGNVLMEVTDDQGQISLRSWPNFELQPTLLLLETPEFFSQSVLDRNGFLAYYSNYPNYQPYIGLQTNGNDELIVNTRDALENGNVTVHHIAFSQTNELYAATDRGIMKYLGRDE